MTGDSVQGEKLAGDHAVTQNEPKNDQEQQQQDSRFATDVPDLFADGEKGGLPVFDVSSAEFYNNMKTDRLRLRFKSGSTAQAYHQKSKYRRPFWIRNKEDGFTYKIK